MNIWLLGNGFDLAHTLPTKYENFIHTMEFLIKHKDKKFNTVGEIFGNEELQKKDKLIAESYEKYSEAYNQMKMDLWYNSLELKEMDYKSNCWLNYFIKCFNRELGWIDFEKEIGSVIDIFKKLFSKDENSLKSRSKKSVLSEDERYFNILALDYEPKQILESFSFFYEESPTCAWIKKNYLESKPYGSDNVVIKRQKIADDLYSSLRDFTFLLCIYLTVFVEALEKNIEKLKEFNDLNNARAIVSFNYTRTVETLYDKCEVCHIHGVNTNFVDSIVLGINSDNDDKLESVNTLFLNFKKYYQRVRYNTDIKYMQMIDSLKSNNNNNRKKNVLFVVGHSLDVTDEDIIKELFDLADEIVIHCHTPSITGVYIKNLINIYGREGFDYLRKNKCLVFENFIDEDSYQKHHSEDSLARRVF